MDKLLTHQIELLKILW